MDVTKPWDKAALLAELKAQGLPALEKDLEMIVKVMYEWAEKSLLLQGGLYASFGLPALGMARPYLDAAVNKIDNDPLS